MIANEARPIHHHGGPSGASVMVGLRGPEGPAHLAEPRTFSRSRQASLKTSYGAKTFHVAGCQRLRRTGAGSRSMEWQHATWNVAAWRVWGRVAGGVPTHDETLPTAQTGGIS